MIFVQLQDEGITNPSAASFTQNFQEESSRSNDQRPLDSTKILIDVYRLLETGEMIQGNPSRIGLKLYS